MTVVEPSRWDTEELLIHGKASRVVQVPYTEVPALITSLRRAYNAWRQQQEQSQADGVVASVLLQSAVADAPGDFS